MGYVDVRADRRTETRFVRVDFNQRGAHSAERPVIAPPPTNRDMRGYVGPFPGGRKQRVSPDGGSLPRWNRDGRELYYLASDGRLVSVPTLTTGELTVGTPTTLFRTGGVAKWVTFDVSPDGKRFAAVVPPAGAAIAVVQHSCPRRNAEKDRGRQKIIMTARAA
jgi:hypothetical protein